MPARGFTNISFKLELEKRLREAAARHQTTPQELIESWVTMDENKTKKKGASV